MAQALPVAVLILALVVPAYALWQAGRSLSALPTDAPAYRSFLPARSLSLLANSAVVAGTAVAVALVLGGVFGLVAGRTDAPGRRSLHRAALLAACVPLHAVLTFIFTILPLSALQGSAAGCGLLYGVAYTPLAIVLLAAAFRRVDPELEEQALLDARPPMVVWHVTLRETVPTFTVLALLVALAVGTDTAIADLLVVRSFAEEVYSQFRLGAPWAGPMLAGLPWLMVLAAALVLALTATRGGPPEQHTLMRPPRLFKLGRWRLPSAAVCLAGGLAVICVPVLGMVREVRTVTRFGQAARGVWPELLNSGVASMTTAGVLVVLGIGLAWLFRVAPRGRWLLGAAMAILLAMPAPVTGISLVELLNRPGLAEWTYDLPVGVCLGYVVRFLPIAVLLLIPAVRRVPAELIMAARSDGAGWLAVQRHVVWPLVRPDAAVVWLVLVLLEFAEIGASIVLVPPGWPMASVRVATLLHWGVNADLMVLAWLSAAVIVVPWLVLGRLLSRREQGVWS